MGTSRLCYTYYIRPRIILDSLDLSTGTWFSHRNLKAQQYITFLTSVYCGVLTVLILNVNNNIKNDIQMWEVDEEMFILFCCQIHNRYVLANQLNTYHICIAFSSTTWASFSCNAWWTRCGMHLKTTGGGGNNRELHYRNAILSWCESATSCTHKIYDRQRATNDECVGVVLRYFWWCLGKLRSSLVFILCLLVNIPVFSVVFLFNLICLFGPAFSHAPQFICHSLMSFICFIPSSVIFFWYSVDFCLLVCLFVFFCRLSFCAVGYVWCTGTAAVTALPRLAFFPHSRSEKRLHHWWQRVLKTSLNHFGFYCSAVVSHSSLYLKNS